MSISLYHRASEVVAREIESAEILHGEGVGEDPRRLDDPFREDFYHHDPEVVWGMSEEEMENAVAALRAVRRRAWWNPWRWRRLSWEIALLRQRIAHSHGMEILYM